MLILCNCFVSMSAIMTSVGWYFKHTSPSYIFSQMKWCCISISLVREWYVCIFASTILPWLSYMMDVVHSCTNPLYTKSYLSQLASSVQWLVAMYSASVVDHAMVDCFLHFHKEHVPCGGSLVVYKILWRQKSSLIGITKSFQKSFYFSLHNLKFLIQKS